MNLTPDEAGPASGAAPGRRDAYPDDLIRSILGSVKSIAIVGISASNVRPSWIVASYMSKRGYRVYGVNPGLAGQEIAGSPVVGALADLPEPVDMVDIFRNSAAAGAIVDEALSLPVPPKVIWMQLTVRNDEAAARAEARGCTVIMDRCPKIEYGRLSGEITWNGVNSRVLSSKRRVSAGGAVQRMTLGAWRGGPSFRGRG
ncbi:CoA-binding protein [Camelimonas abortus]|uniref:CoA-binding protein n=1 Tax=Camelimonas abortus TaxID=1017184 RepID=A0ABV7LG75_9HYPH